MRRGRLRVPVVHSGAVHRLRFLRLTVFPGVQFANKTYQDYFVSLACLVVGGAVGWYFLSKPKDSHDEVHRTRAARQEHVAPSSPRPIALTRPRAREPLLP